MKLRIEEITKEHVVVVDGYTNFKVAIFLYQRDIDGNEKFDALALANEFIYMMRALEERTNARPNRD